MNMIRRIRRDFLSLSQIELANLLGVSQGTVSKWERGELSPNLKEIAVIRSEIQARGLAWDDRLFFEDVSTP